MPKATPQAPMNCLHESTHRVSNRAKVISDLDETELALLMRKNAEALFLDLAGGTYSRAFNPMRSPKSRRGPDRKKQAR